MFYACIKLLCGLNLNLDGCLCNNLLGLLLCRSSIVLANKNNDGSGNVTVKLNGDIVATSGLDSSATSNALTINGDVELCLDCVSNLSGGDGAKELALLADASVNSYELAIKSCLGSICVSNTLLFALSMGNSFDESMVSTSCCLSWTLNPGFLSD